MLAGDFANCIPNCFDGVNDALLTAGAGPGDSGIEMTRVPSTSCCNFVANVSIANCDCNLGMLTPSSAGSLTLLGCEKLNGVCVVRARFTFAGAVYEVIPFNLSAVESDPNVLTRVSPAACCDSPETVEVFV